MPVSEVPELCHSLSLRRTWCHRCSRCLFFRAQVPVLRLPSDEVDQLSVQFFFLWRGRKCTRLGPYNCVSSENLSEKDPYGPKMANPLTALKKKRKQPRPANPPARFAFRRKSTSKNNKENGAGPNHNNQSRFAMMILLLFNSTKIKNMQMN